jgi:hypothetical protein
MLGFAHGFEVVVFGVVEGFVEVFLGFGLDFDGVVDVGGCAAEALSGEISSFF